MNNDIIKSLSVSLNIKAKQVETVLELLGEGNTVPFIARYRKEATGALDETKIKEIETEYKYLENLENRKESIKNILKEKELLTKELEESINKCIKLVDLEDIYRPYKEKKKTKATEAINNGLEPLAKIIMSSINKNIEEEASKFITDKVKTTEDAISGAKYIIAEWISDNAYYRKWIRNYIKNSGILETKVKKNANDENKTYEMYYEYSESIKGVKPHRVLAINRGEKEKILTVNINIEDEKVIDYIKGKEIKENNNLKEIIKEAIEDSYKRLIKPSIDREIRSELTEVSEEKAIEVFSKNLKQLLLTPPMKDKRILGIDPAFRTGCKLAIIDETSKPLHIDVIYPHEPQNKYKEAIELIIKLCNKYNIDLIAIGNGTASRETEKLVSDAIKEMNNKISYVIVSEAGASVYSASKLAIEEFPDLTVEKRSAISIARRLTDPLAELVKIDPKSIGVGQYQHDINQTKLNDSLTFVVESAVNQVGVNVNTASPSLLSYISGLSMKLANNLVKYRDVHGKFKTRSEIKDIEGLGAKTYTQAIGFLRIPDGINKLDATPIHPESYKQTKELLKLLNIDINNLNNLEEKLNNINKEEICDKINIDEYTLDDIIEALLKPNRDPREEYDTPILKSDILTIEDLKEGMKLQGTVRNIVDFGAFIDIGLKNDGLAHISKISKNYIKHPLDVLSVGDIVDCYIYSIDKDKKKVGLSLIEE